MKKCPKCGKTYDDSWGVCLSCNEKLVDSGPSIQNIPKKEETIKKPPSKKKRVAIQLSVIFLILFVNSALDLLSGLSALSTETAVYKMTWHKIKDNDTLIDALGEPLDGYGLMSDKYYQSKILGEQADKDAVYDERRDPEKGYSKKFKINGILTLIRDPREQNNKDEIKINFLVSGPKNTGRVYVTAKRSDNTLELSNIYVEVDEERIDL